MASTDSEDVEARCKQCGRSMGNATVRSTNPRSLQKMKWILGRLLCPACEDAAKK